MFGCMRFRPSGSMLVALVALVMATTGSAVAASLITSKQIKDGTIQTKDISKKALNALNGKTGPAGALGPQGPQGSKGDKGDPGTNGTNGTNGATKVVVRTAQTTTSSGGNGSATAQCNAGERATGGGVQMGPGNSANVWYFQPGGIPTPSTAGATPTGWYSSWYNASGSTDTFTVYVVCASP